MNNSNKTYVGPYKVVKVMRKSCNHITLRRGLTLEQARNLVNSYPDSNTSMVVFYKQYSGCKWFV